MFNNRGFTLIEVLGCVVLLGLILGIVLYNVRDTLSTTLTTLDYVSENEIYDAALNYSMENGNLCVSVNDLVDMGYFDYDEVVNYRDKYVRISRDSITKVVNDSELVDDCE